MAALGLETRLKQVTVRKAPQAGFCALNSQDCGKSSSKGQFLGSMLVFGSVCGRKITYHIVPGPSRGG